MKNDILKIAKAKISVKSPVICLLLIVLFFMSCTEKKNEAGAQAVIEDKHSVTKQHESLEQKSGKDTEILLEYAERFRECKETYDEGENFYERKEYQNAIKSYKSFTDDAIYYLEYDAEIKAHLESEFGKLFDDNGQLKLFYYSIYNTACCYSLLQDYENAKKYLEYAIYAGYPNLNYIFKDSDMAGLFAQDEAYKAELAEIFEQGNSIDFLNGKIFRREHRAYYGFSGDDVVVEFEDTKWKGKFRLQNYHILMNFTREAYRQPDLWASHAHGGIDVYSSYDPYPVLSDIQKSGCLNWFSEILYVDEYKRTSSEILKKEFVLEWDDTDYSELRKKRNEEYYAKNRKVERDENEIKASAERRRQKVLSYIENADTDDKTVFIVPEGTTEIDSDFSFPEETVAILLPEGLEIFDCGHVPDSVKYINFPSTLKKLDGWCFSASSELTELELPENLEELDNVLFWYASDAKRKVYVPGWSETPVKWDKYWDICVDARFGEYLP